MIPDMDDGTACINCGWRPPPEGWEQFVKQDDAERGSVLPVKRERKRRRPWWHE